MKSEKEKEMAEAFANVYNHLRVEYMKTIREWEWYNEMVK